MWHSREFREYRAKEGVLPNFNHTQHTGGIIPYDTAAYNEIRYHAVFYYNFFYIRYKYIFQKYYKQASLISPFLMEVFGLREVFQSSSWGATSWEYFEPKMMSSLWVRIIRKWVTNGLVPNVSYYIPGVRNREVGGIPPWPEKFWKYPPWGFWKNIPPPLGGVKRRRHFFGQN